MSAEHPPCCLELLPPDIFLKIALLVVAHDERMLSLSKVQFVRDSCVTPGSMPMHRAEECCCRTASGAWSNQTDVCFRDVPGVDLFNNVIDMDSAGSHNGGGSHTIGALQ